MDHIFSLKLDTISNRESFITYRLVYVSYFIKTTLTQYTYINITSFVPVCSAIYVFAREVQSSQFETQHQLVRGDGPAFT